MLAQTNSDEFFGKANDPSSLDPGEVDGTGQRQEGGSGAITFAQLT